MPSLFGRKWTKHELLSYVGDVRQIGGVELVRYDDGASFGVRVARMRTGGGLELEVLLDRGMDIGGAMYKGESLVWQSPTGAKAPAFFEPDGRGWLRSFHGGLLVTCGLTTAGAPSTDQGEKLGLHGRASHIPASNVWADGEWQGDDYLLWVQGKVRQNTVFGENLVLSRRIWTRLGENTLWLEDVVENLGYTACPHMMLYHMNFGFPLLAPGTRLVTSGKSPEPRDEDARRCLGSFDRVEEPVIGRKEAVFYHRPGADSAGLAHAGLVGGAGYQVRGAGISFSTDTLPHLIQWKMLGAGEYVMGLEPANCLVEGRTKERATGRLQLVQPGEKRLYRIGFQVFGSEQEAVEWESRVKKV